MRGRRVLTGTQRLTWHVVGVLESDTLNTYLSGSI